MAIKRHPRNYPRESATPRLGNRSLYFVEDLSRCSHDLPDRRREAMPMKCQNPQPIPVLSRDIVAFPRRKPPNMVWMTRLVAATEPPAAALDDGALGDGSNVDGDRVELHRGD